MATRRSARRRSRWLVGGAGEVCVCAALAVVVGRGVCGAGRLGAARARVVATAVGQREKKAPSDPGRGGGRTPQKTQPYSQRWLYNTTSTPSGRAASVNGIDRRRGH